LVSRQNAVSAISKNAGSPLLRGLNHH